MPRSAPDRLAVLPIVAIAAAAFMCGGCGTPSSAASSPPDPASPGGRGVRFAAWSPEAFARAEREGKPIYVNVAAAWCHWCHVMDAETLADAEVARLLNDEFVAIRVDADLRPDVADRYAEWGWPAHAILTPDARPVAERRGFQEARTFAELLRGVSADVRAGRPVARRAPAARRGPVDADLSRTEAAVEARLDGFYDARLEGWGRTQKYPVWAPVEELFRRARAGDAAARGRALATLRQELKITDRAFGGMFQYSVPETWDAPHFEKLAVVQAGALENFAEAAAFEPAGPWLAEAELVRRYVARFLTGADGAFFASQDADLGAHAEDGAPHVPGAEYYSMGEAERLRLGVPRVDRAVYADLNGRLIAAHVALHARTGAPEPLAAAVRATRRLLASHATARGGFAHAAPFEGGLLHLTDQVATGRALIAVYEATGDAAPLRAAEGVARFLLNELEDRDGGGFYAHTADPTAVGVFVDRRKPLVANAEAARLLLRLATLRDEAAFAAAAERALKAFADPAAYEPEGRDLGELLLALRERAAPGPKITLVRGGTDAEFATLLCAALAAHAPGRVIEHRAPDDAFRDLGRPAAYVCTESYCSAPLFDAAALAAELTRR